VPLNEIIANSLGISVVSKKVIKHFNNLIEKIGPELKILLDSEIKEIEQESLPEIAEKILSVRNGNVSVKPGYDGVYGKINIF
jgi:PHP family Zn ribbon phosphoesterase